MSTLEEVIKAKWRNRCQHELQESLELHAKALTSRGQSRQAAGLDKLLGVIESLQNDTQDTKKGKGPMNEPKLHCYNINKYYLKQEEHHEGRALVARIGHELIRMQSAYLTIVEDESGDSDFLMLYNQSPDSTYNVRLRPGDIVAIKHPYYQAITHRLYGLTIYHVSDLLVLEPNNSRIPDGLCEDWTRVGALAWKVEGNAALRRLNFGDAVRCYSRGLLMAPPAELVYADLLRNRANAYMLQGCWEAAMKDCFKVLISRSQDVKALFRLMRCSYELGNYTLAKEKLNMLEDLRPNLNPLNQEQFDKWAGKIKARLEESQGKYNLAAILRNPRLDSDIASFTSMVDMRSTKHSGIGLFAKQTIAAGHLVLFDTPLVTTAPDDSSKTINIVLDLHAEDWDATTGVPLFARAVAAATQNPSVAHKLYRLYAGNVKRLVEPDTLVDGVPVLDTHLISQACKLNAGNPSKQDGATEVSTEGDDSSSRTSCIWPTASFVNHSCLPNAAISPVGNNFIMRAIRDIAADEEVTISYQSFDADVRVRRQSLKRIWGFDCTCELCSIEDRATASVSKQLIYDRTTIARTATAEIESWGRLDLPDPSSEVATPTKSRRRRKDSFLGDSDGIHMTKKDGEIYFPDEISDAPPKPQSLEDRLNTLSNMIDNLQSTYPTAVYPANFPLPSVLPFLEILFLLYFRLARYGEAHSTALSYLRCAGWVISGASVETLTLDRSKALFPLFPLYRSAIVRAFLVLEECERMGGDEAAREKFGLWARECVALVAVDVEGRVEELKRLVGIPVEERTDENEEQGPVGASADE